MFFCMLVAKTPNEGNMQKNMHFFEVFCKFWLQNPQIQNACFLHVGPQGQNTQIQNACFFSHQSSIINHLTID